MIGAIQAIAVQKNDPATAFDDAEIVYVATINGGVWRTTGILQANVVWEPMTDDLPASSMGAIAINPTNPNMVLAGTGRFSNFGGMGSQPVGLYRTLEGNKINGKPKWEHMTGLRFFGDPDTTKVNIFNSLPISSIVYSRTTDATPKQVILVGTGGVAGGLFRSTDGGAVWTLVSGSINAPDSVDNNNNGKVDKPGEVNANDGTDNDGDETIDNTGEINLPRKTIFDMVAVPDSSIVFATNRLNGGVFRSNDAGASWVPMNQGTEACFFPEDRYPDVGQCVHKVLAHPGRPGRLWQQNHCGVYRSDDGGASWERLDGNGLPSGFGFGLALDPGDPDRAFVIPEDGAENRVTCNGRLGIYATADAGASWNLIVAEEPAWAAVLREGMSFDDEAVYAGTQSGHVYALRHDEVVEAARHLPPILSVEAAPLQ